MKKIASVFLSLALILAVCIIPVGPVYAAGLSMSVSRSEINIGDTVTVTVSVPEGHGATVNVSFDSSILSFSGTSLTSNTNGDVVIMNMGDAMGYANSATITFKAVSAGSVSFSAEASSAGDVDGEPVSLTGASASLTVANQISEETPGGSTGGETGGTPGGNTGGSTGGNTGGNTGGETGGTPGGNTGGNGGGTTGGGQQEPPKSGNNALASLTLSAGTLSPAFKQDTTNYTAVVDYNVTSIAISATPQDAKATVTSVTGNENLKEGENTINVVVRAENGVKRTYTILVTRSPRQDTPQQEKPQFSYNGQKISPAEQIPEEVIPVDFTAASVNIGQVECPCLDFHGGKVTLLYLVPENSEEGRLFVYDKGQDAVFPFVKLSAEQGYVIILLPKVEEIPAGYTETLLSIEGKGIVTAYQRLYGEDGEEAETDEKESEKGAFWNLFGPEKVYAAEPNPVDYFLLYCVNNQGENGWYQYDSKEGTFQRYIKMEPVVITDQKPGEDNQAAAAADYNRLQEQMKNLKQRDLKIISVLAAVIVLLVLGIVGIVIFWRRSLGDGYREEVPFDIDMSEVEDFSDSEPFDETEESPENEEGEEENDFVRKEETRIYDMGSEDSPFLKSDPSREEQETDRPQKSVIVQMEEWQRKDQDIENLMNEMSEDRLSQDTKEIPGGLKADDEWDDVAEIAGKLEEQKQKDSQDVDDIFDDLFGENKDEDMEFIDIE